MDEAKTVRLLTIGEFAEATGLSISAVRFYANRGVLPPAEIDARSGYRRYAERQIDDGRLIRDLRRLDMPLSDIASALAMSVSERQALVEGFVAELVAKVERVHVLAQSMSPSVSSTPTKEPTMPTQSATIAGAASLPARTLRQGLSQVLPAISNDSASPHLMSVLIEVEQGSLRLVATDRHRLAVRDIVPASIAADFSVVAAGATMAEWASQLDVDGDITIGADDAALSLTGAVTAHADRLPVDYPDYRSVLEAPTGVTTVTIEGSALRAVLDEVAEAVTIDVASDSVRLTTSTVAAEIQAACSGADQSVLLDPAYLRDALDSTVGHEVVIDIVEPLAPLVIRSADDGTFTTMLMPIAPEVSP